MASERISGPDRKIDQRYNLLCLCRRERSQRLSSLCVRILGKIVSRPDDEPRWEFHAGQILDQGIARATSDIRDGSRALTREDEIPLCEIVQEGATEIRSQFFFVGGCLKCRIDIFVHVTIERDTRSHVRTCLFAGWLEANASSGRDSSARSRAAWFRRFRDPSIYFYGAAR
jgi:hypothetical protein